MAILRLILTDTEVQRIKLAALKQGRLRPSTYVRQVILREIDSLLGPAELPRDPQAPSPAVREVPLLASDVPRPPGLTDEQWAKVLQMRGYSPHK